jgi:hypothetical protein
MLVKIKGIEAVKIDLFPGEAEHSGRKKYGDYQRKKASEEFPFCRLPFAFVFCLLPSLRVLL